MTAIIAADWYDLAAAACASIARRNAAQAIPGAAPSSSRAASGIREARSDDALSGGGFSPTSPAAPQGAAGAFPEERA